MTSSPFENPEAAYCVLVNDEGQYSIWPAEIAVPSGWYTACGDGTRNACLAYVARNWKDERRAEDGRAR